MSIYDGELVVDQNPQSPEEKPMLTFLIFDCMVVAQRTVMHLNFRDRLKAGDAYVKRNHSVYRLLIERQKEAAKPDAQLPFLTLYMKDIFEIWDTPKLLSLSDH